MTAKRPAASRAGPSSRTQISEPAITRMLLADTNLAPLWLLARLYVGSQWLRAGWIKLVDPAGAWVGAHAGAGVAERVALALRQPAGAGTEVARWYVLFLERVVLPNAATVAYVLTVAEIIVGLAAIVGLFTGFTAFFGGAIHALYLLPGDPILLILATLLALSWRVAGYYGLDRWLLPLVGVPGYPGTLFRASRQAPRFDDPPVHI